MAVISGFFNASEQSGQRDRVYSAEDFGAIFDGVISDGIFENYMDAFKVVPSNNTLTGHLEVIVKPGRAWLNKTWTLNDSDEAVKLDSRDAVSNRIDEIYIKVDKDSRQNSLYVNKGEESSTPVIPTPPEDIEEHVYHHLIARILVSGSTNIDDPILKKDITNMVNVDGGTPYVVSNVTDPNITTATILTNLENQFDSYQSRYTDQFVDWFDSIKDSLGEITADQIIEIAEMVADIYSTDYLSGGYPYVNDNCLHLSSSKAVLPPVIINFGFVTGSMYPNKDANEVIVYTGTIESGG